MAHTNITRTSRQPHTYKRSKQDLVKQSQINNYETNHDVNVEQVVNED
jgi:hypothetical protein